MDLYTYPDARIKFLLPILMRTLSNFVFMSQIIPQAMTETRLSNYPSNRNLGPNPLSWILPLKRENRFDPIPTTKFCTVLERAARKKVKNLFFSHSASSQGGSQFLAGSRAHRFSSLVFDSIVALAILVLLSILSKYNTDFCSCCADSNISTPTQ